MSDNITLNAEPRALSGTSASRRLRRQGAHLPAILYGGESDPQPITLRVNEVARAMQEEAFFAQVVDIVIDGEAQKAVVRDVQLHPVNERVQHMDLLRVRTDQPVTTHVPLHYLNEDKCVGARTGGGSIAHNLVDVEVSALPADLPAYLEVDLADLDVGESVHLTDLDLPQGVSLVALTQGADHDILVAAVHPPRGGAKADEDEEAEESEADQ